jgi:hypothetical protein
MATPVQSYNLFGTGGVHQAKVTLNNKQDVTVLPSRVTIQFFPFNFEMETSLLLDFLFAISLGVPIQFDDFTWQGINITFPDFSNYLQSLNISPFNIPNITVVSPEAQGNYSQTQITKAIFGQSVFDYSYYDPGLTVVNIKQWLRSAINKISRNMTTPSFLQGVNVNQGFSIYANKMLNTVMQIIEKSTPMDVMILDFSQFAPESVTNPLYVVLPYQWLTTISELNGTTATPQFAVIDQALWGTVLDWNPLDGEYFIDEPVPMVNLNFAQLVGRIGEAVQNNYSPLQTAIKTAFIDPAIPNIPIPPSLTQLFQEAFPDIAENASFAPLTARAERWGRAMELIKTIRKTIRNMLMNTVANPIMINAYEDAGVEYCMAFHHNHDRVRFRAWDGVGLNAFNQAWISKWINFGLDPNTLNTLLNILSTICPNPIPGFKGQDSPL